MSEEEARTKWCPMARVYSPDGAYNKEGGCLAHGSTCIASDCMKWPECKFWWERPTIEQIKADYDKQARKTAQIIVAEFDTKHGGTT